MLQKLPVDNFKWRNNKSNFDEKFIKSYDKDSTYLKRVHAEVDVENPNFHSYLPFFPERMKIRKWCKLTCHVTKQYLLCK